MNIYRISQTTNKGCNAYSSAIVYAEDEEKARWVHPAGWTNGDSVKENKGWCKCANVRVELLGIANDPNILRGVILSSFSSEREKFKKIYY